MSLVTDLLGGWDAEVRWLGSVAELSVLGQPCGHAEAALGCPEPLVGTKGLTMTWEMVFRPCRSARH